MRPALLLLLAIAISPTAHAAAREQWLVTIDYWGNPVYQALELNGDGSTLSGNLDGDPLTGDKTGDRIHFSVTDTQGDRYVLTGTQTGDAINGIADTPDSNHKGVRIEHAFTARRIPDKPPGVPRKIDFTPTSYANEFSPHIAPVLTIWPGDTVRTSTIDSGGINAQGRTVSLFGNPQTGPFFVAGAKPGDILAIHIKRLALNRDFADSLDMIVGRAQTLGMAPRAADLGQPVRWTLDRKRNVARLSEPGDRLRALEVPMQPMLGGLAVAPGFGSAPISTGDTGRFGGNMDFNEVREGNTVYLPVSQPGALLYLGDAHALQGDGETSQYALETSMHVEFSVDVLPARPMSSPRVESPTQLMVLGQAGSLDEAVRVATAGLAQWLEQDYGLTLSESAKLFGSAMQFQIANLAGRNVGVAARIDKSVLRGIKRLSPVPPRP